jgi:excisionase family DNA binding protein
MYTERPTPLGYTCNEVARMMGVKPSTVRAWISRKEMQAYKSDNRRYITKQQIQNFYIQRGSGEYVDTTYANGPVPSYHIT